MKIKFNKYIECKRVTIDFGGGYGIMWFFDKDYILDCHSIKDKTIHIEDPNWMDAGGYLENVNPEDYEIINES